MFNALHIAAVIGTVLTIAGILWQQYAKRDRTAALADADESARWFEAVRALPETDAFDPQPDVVRGNLRSVPVQPDLRLVPPPADDSWLEDLLADDPLQIPQQRRPGSAS